MTIPPKPGLHPRNLHRHGYDFDALVAACPELEAHLHPGPHGQTTLDFVDPAAVKRLNQALLHQAYGLTYWDLPEGFLCPPIPGRADHVHRLADLLAEARGGELPPGKAIRILDIGTGANLIYPILARRIYGWRGVGTDIDAAALASAQAIVAANASLRGAVQLRLQRDPGSIFKGVVRPGERFDLTLCNPPFHGSLQSAREGSRRKWQNLGRGDAEGSAPTLNFGGQGAELWCPGGESGFLDRLIRESAGLQDRVLWFSTLVSKATTLPGAHKALQAAGAQEVRELEMVHGQKRSRILAWTYLTPEARTTWAHGWNQV